MQLRLCVCALQTPDTVVLPQKASSNNSQGHMTTLHILKVLEFNVQTLKSGVVVRDSHALGSNGLLFVRGAAGVIKGLAHPTSLPPDFDQVRLQS